MQLIRSSWRNASGFKWVYQRGLEVQTEILVYSACINGGPLARRINPGGRKMGVFSSAHEAALTVARACGPELSRDLARVAQEENRAHEENAPLSPEEVARIAATEGLTLDKGGRSSAGYRGVQILSKRQGAAPRAGSRDFMAKVCDCYLGTFYSAEEAALAVARKKRDVEREGERAEAKKEAEEEAEEAGEEAEEEVEEAEE